MNREATPRKPSTLSSSSSRRYRYTKVCDNRKQPIRGLWRRNGSFFARITVEDDLGRKALKWIPLEATSAAEAQEEFRGVLVERDENRLRPVGMSPLFTDYAKVYLERQLTGGKKPDTVVTERGHITGWVEALGHLRLDKIRAHHITGHCQRLREAKKAARTCNLAVVCLRNVLKSARIDGHIKASPADGLPWFKTDKTAHQLYSPQELEQLVVAALTARFIKGEPVRKGEGGEPMKNGPQFVDYIRFLQYSGAREQEALKIRWADVSLERGFVTIGAQGESKNREARTVDMSHELEQLLREMAARRAPDSTWLFPSPQRGEKDEHARTFRESLLLARQAAGLPEFGFHLADEHRKAQAKRIIFSPTILKEVEEA